MLNKITFTGADNQTDIKEMIQLSFDYPHVEFAILFSKNKSGVERYPDAKWVKNLLDNAPPHMNLAAHLCGQWVDDITKGNMSFLDIDIFREKFKRIQLNCTGKRLNSIYNSNVFEQLHKYSNQFILGGNYKNVYPNLDNLKEGHICPLFDCSGGKGILSSWQKPFTFKDKPIYCGYAGGLNPGNVKEEVIKIKELGEFDFWIDAETGLRENSQFSLEKCKSFIKELL